MSDPSRGGNPAAPHRYPGIPPVEYGQDFCPLKAFCASQELVLARGSGQLLDGPEVATGTINRLERSADSGGSRVGLPFERLRHLLAREEAHRRASHIVLDGGGSPAGFEFGVLDVATIPSGSCWAIPSHRMPNAHAPNSGRSIRTC